MGRSVASIRKSRGVNFLIAAAILLSTIASTFVPQPVSANEFFAPDADQVYFEQTGQVLGGAFLEAWDNLGGVGRTGKPITPAVQHGDHWVQWFEFAILQVPIAEPYTQNVTYAPAGKLYAEKLGYTLWHPAFKRVEGAGEGAMYFEETGHTLANAMLEAWNDNNYHETLGAPISEEFQVGIFIYQFFERGAFAWNEYDGVEPVPIGILDATVNGQYGPKVEKPEVARVWNQRQFARSYPAPGERWIDVNLTNYTLTAYEGDVPVLSTYVVIGASMAPTVQGEFSVYWKLEKQTMEGMGWTGLEYRQEDVPWVMYFFEDYAIHGAYWRDSFGYAGSNGCVNLPTGVAEQLYHWTPYGARVVVHTGS
jgi:lipoprotein-anchoring transpeptidase ErfK/SrfK